MFLSAFTDPRMTVEATVAEGDEVVVRWACTGTHEGEPQAQASGSLWRGEYNTERPHSSLGYKTPAEFAAGRERYVPIEETEAKPPPGEQPHP